MPCPHYKIKVSSRSKTAPTTAQAAYQSGDRLFDERTHRTKNYSEKSGIEYTEIMLPNNAPREYADRNTLWNAVEKSEQNWNSQLARRIEIALPKELPMETRIKMLREHVQEQFVSKGMIADIAIHDPYPKGHNPHAHVMLTMRAMDENGKWLPKSRREYELDPDGNRIRDGNGDYKFRKVFTTDWDDRSNAEKWRQAWEDTQNRYLEEANRPERISMKSYERQGINQIPTVHMGPSVTAMEKKGITTNIGNLNRDIKKTNAISASIHRTIDKAKRWLSELTAAVREIEMEPKQVLLVDLLIRRFEARKEERGTWNSISGQNKAAINDFKKFAEITAFMQEKNILDIDDLDNRLAVMSNAERPIRDEIKTISTRNKTIEKLLDAGKRRSKLAPIHDEYSKIFWKGRKEKFAKEHSEELKAWKQADKFIRKYMPDEPFSAKTLKNDLSSLSAKIDELNAQLVPIQEETRMLKDIRYYVKDLIPELVPEGANLTPEKKEVKKKSLMQDLSEKKKIVEANKATHQQNPRKHDRDTSL